MKKVAIPEKNGSNRKILLFFLFAAGILSITVSIIDSVNLSTGNSHIFTGTKGLTVTIVPANISAPSSLSGLVNVEVTVQGKTDLSKNSTPDSGVTAKATPATESDLVEESKYEDE